MVTTTCNSSTTELKRLPSIVRAMQVGWRMALSKGSLSLVDQAVVSGTSFLTSVILARLTSQESLGVFFLAWNVVTMARAIQGDLITSPYMMYHRRREGEQLARYGGSVLMHEFIFCALSCLTMSGLIVFSGFGAGQAHSTTMWTVVGAIPLLLLREFIRNVSFAHLHVGMVLMTDAIIAVVQLSGLLLLHRFGWLQVSTAYGIIAAACLLASLVWFWFDRPPWTFDASQALADFKSNWIFGRWALASQLTGRAASFALPWVVALMHGEAITGVLAACTTLINIAGMFVTGVSNYLTPRAAEAYSTGGARALKSVLRRVAWLYLATVGSFCFAVFIGGEQIATLVYGDRYSGQQLALSLLAVSMLLNSFGITVGNGLWALDRPRANFAADVASLIVSALAMFLLVGRFGVLGAATSTLAGTAAALGLRYWALRQEFVHEATATQLGVTTS